MMECITFSIIKKKALFAGIQFKSCSLWIHAKYSICFTIFEHLFRNLWFLSFVGWQPSGGVWKHQTFTWCIHFYTWAFFYFFFEYRLLFTWIYFAIVHDFHHFWSNAVIIIFVLFLLLKMSNFRIVFYFRTWHKYLNQWE